jgi:LysR family hydrogen peroxide-inducible transcriptional activator
MTDPLPFTLRQLQYATAVAELRSFRRAAASCRVAQPSLSQQVAALEEAIGLQLFERTPRTVRATPAGEGFLARASLLLRDARDLGDEARRAADPLSGALRIGAIPTVAPYLLPEVLPRLRAAFPQLRPIWREDKTARLLEALQAGELDGVVLADAPHLAVYRRVVLFEDPLLLLLPASHPLASRPGPVAAEQLGQETVLLLDEGHCLRDNALPFCARAGLHEAGFRATSLSTLTHLVASGAGVTLIPELALATEARRNDVAVRRLAAPEPGRTIVFLWRPGSALGPALAAVARCLVGRS